MKKFIIISLTLLLGFTTPSIAQNTHIHGHIDGMPLNTQIFMNEVVGGHLQPRDTIKVDDNGNFSWKTQLKEAAFFVAGFNMNKSPDLHIILLPKENVTINMRYTPSFNHLRLTHTDGSANMEAYKMFNNLMPAGNDDIAQWNLKQNISDIILSHKNCLISAFLVTFFENEFTEHADLYLEVRDALIKKYPNDDFVKHLDNKLKGAIIPGMVAPDIVMQDPDGKTRKLSDLKGNVVLIDFWASWCSPCRKENPNVVKIYNQYHNQGFDIFSVSLDKDRAAWVKAIKDDGLVWNNHVSDLTGWTSSGGATYGITSVPSTVLVDRDGKVVARNLRGPELERKLKEIMAK